MIGKVRVRLAFDPKIQNGFIVQIWDEPKWTTLVSFNNEMLAKNHFAKIKRFGVGLRTVDEAEVDYWETTEP